MNLVILPGGGNPDTQYKQVYALLEDGAKKYGYKHIDTSLRWPGHIDPKEKMTHDELTLEGAMERAVKKLKEYEEKQMSYDLLGRSFGCLVALRYATQVPTPKLLKNIILYGPVPYWRIWEVFARDIGESSKNARKRGLSIDSTYFPTVVPIESMLPSVEFPTVVVLGEKDEYVNIPGGHAAADYLYYLKKIVGSKSNFYFRIVLAASHTITKDNSSPEVIESYLDMLFNTKASYA